MYKRAESRSVISSWPAPIDFTSHGMLSPVTRLVTLSSGTARWCFARTALSGEGSSADLHATAGTAVTSRASRASGTVRLSRGMASPYVGRATAAR